MLDAGSLHYSYSILAAAAVCHLYSQHDALSVSGWFSACESLCPVCVTVSCLQHIDTIGLLGDMEGTWTVNSVMKHSPVVSWEAAVAPLVNPG